MVYFISGLGADERVFQFLDLAKLPHQFIRWNEPKKDESLSAYCLTLTKQIDTTKEIILIGVSFGGIIAQEIAKIVTCKKIIIISSVKSINEYSWQLKIASKLQIHKITPLWLLTLGNKLTAGYFFGIQRKQESILLHQIIKDTDPKFLVWAIDQLMNWKNQTYPENLIHIHGILDRIFPIKSISNVLQITNGGHFMIVNKSAQIQEIIFELIGIPRK